MTSSCPGRSKGWEDFPVQSPKLTIPCSVMNRTRTTSRVHKTQKTVGRAPRILKPAVVLRPQLTLMMKGKMKAKMKMEHRRGRSQTTLGRQTYNASIQRGTGI